MNIISTTYGLDISWDSYINLTFKRFIRLLLLQVPLQIYCRLKLICERSQFPLHHLDSDIMHEIQFLDHYHGPIRMLCARTLISSIRIYLYFLFPYSSGIIVLKLGELMEVE